MHTQGSFEGIDCDYCYQYFKHLMSMEFWGQTLCIAASQILDSMASK